MKRVGKTDKGNVLIELSEDEFRELKRLALSVEGVDLFNIAFSDKDKGYSSLDLSTVFGAIRVFTETIAIVTALKNLVAQIEEAMIKKTEQGVILTGVLYTTGTDEN